MVQKILLIDIDNETLRYEASKLHSQWAHHPLGLMYLAAAVREVFPDVSIKIFHTITQSNPLEYIKYLIADFDPDIIGLRALSIAQNHFRKIASLIRIQKPETLLIAGGPYPSSSFGDILEAGIVDLVVVGEGEATFIELINWLRSHNKLPMHLQGTAVMCNGRIKTNDPRPPIANLNILPFPAYDLIRLDDYRGLSNHAFQNASQSAFICSSRGCIFNCIYCHQLFGKRIRRRSSENIIEEMREHIEKRGITNFVFVDDLFNVPIDSAKKILSDIIRKLPKVKLNFPNGMRADQIDNELILLLEKAGTVHIAFAVETASQRLQKFIGKNLDLVKAKKMIAEASRRFIVCGFFMIGFPSETYAEAEETISYAEDFEYLSQPTLSVLRVFNNTKIWTMLDPDEVQYQALVEQERQMLQPKLFSQLSFYGDVFPKDKVPLNSDDIQTLQWEWVRRVLNNQMRIKNSHTVIQKFLSDNEIITFYQNLFDNPKFNEKSLSRLLRSS